MHLREREKIQEVLRPIALHQFLIDRRVIGAGGLAVDRQHKPVRQERLHHQANLKGAGQPRSSRARVILDPIIFKFRALVTYISDDRPLVFSRLFGMVDHQDLHRTFRRF
jgi:hypothetical protein